MIHHHDHHNHHHHHGNLKRGVGTCSFLCENFYQRLQLAPEDVVGCPLASIVDDRDAYALRNTLFQVLNQGHRCAAGRESAGGGGSLIHLRIAHGGISCEASMTIVRGSQGLIVVTRLYNA